MTAPPTGELSSAAERLRGRVAVVTGGGSGIGAATVSRLGAEGAAVAVLDRNETAVRQTVAALRSEGVEALPVPCDVTRRDEVESAMSRVVSALGGLDILVHSAGVIRDQLLFKMSDEDWDQVLGVNLTAAFLLTRAAQAQMVRQRFGRLVYLSSTSALGNRGQANYSAAKAGIEGLTRTLAIELGPFGITVNAVAPGFIATAMTDAVARRQGLDPLEYQHQVAQTIPLRRVGQPADVAGVIAFLCSDDAAYVSGQVVYVNGARR